MSKVDKDLIVGTVMEWINSADEKEAKQLLMVMAGPIISTVLDNLIEAEVLEFKC